MGKNNVEVFVRVRPQLPRELIFDHAVETTDETVKAHKDSQALESTYDSVFGEDSTQEQVYSRLNGNVLASLSGFNSTLFAYGQTGTGKTYTMFGRQDVVNGNLDPSTSSEVGIIPRAILNLFKSIEKKREVEGCQIQLVCSYMEIYNDRLYDLLQPVKKGARRDPMNMLQKRTTLEVREDQHGGTYVPNLLCVKVDNFKAVCQLLQSGNRHRAIRQTEMNQHSSRSHAILQLVVEQWPSDAASGSVIRSKVNFVDLAGSERWNKDANMGNDRVSEMTSINSSLCALASVVSALVEKRQHIPYRDSKLTHLLQDSLGGNCKTAIIATVSPSVDAFEETCSTLRFADRAKAISNNAIVNTGKDMGSVLAMKEKEITRLRQMLLQMTERNGNSPAPATAERDADQEKLMEELEATRRALELERKLRNELESRLQRVPRDMPSMSSDRSETPIPDPSPGREIPGSAWSSTSAIRTSPPQSENQASIPQIPHSAPPARPFGWDAPTRPEAGQAWPPPLPPSSRAQPTPPAPPIQPITHLIPSTVDSKVSLDAKLKALQKINETLLDAMGQGKQPVLAPSAPKTLPTALPEAPNPVRRPSPQPFSMYLSGNSKAKDSKSKISPPVARVKGPRERFSGMGSVHHHLKPAHVRRNSFTELIAAAEASVGLPLPGLPPRPFLASASPTPRGLALAPASSSPPAMHLASPSSDDLLEPRALQSPTTTSAPTSPRYESPPAPTPPPPALPAIQGWGRSAILAQSQSAVPTATDDPPQIWGRSSVFHGALPTMDEKAEVLVSSRQPPERKEPPGRPKRKQANHVHGKLDAGSWIYILGAKSSSVKAKALAQVLKQDALLTAANGIVI